jgi:hypothetical protein
MSHMGCKPANAGFLRRGRLEDMLRSTALFDFGTHRTHGAHLPPATSCAVDH